MNTITPSASDFIKTGMETAEFFGFQSIDSLKTKPECQQCRTKIPLTTSASERKKDALHGLLTSGLGVYCDARLNARSEPALFYTTERVPRSNEVALTFNIIGVEKSIAEAILIQAMRSLLTELGYADYVVRVNSLGDQDSITRYIRELTNYLRKRIDHLPASARELMKDHVLTALMHLIDTEHELGMRSPSPLEYLSDQSRKHFREIVEYLDMSETPYEIDPKLMGHHHCYSDALFSIDLLNQHETEISPIIARGGRYSEYAQRASKSNLPAVGGVIVLRERTAPARTPRPQFTSTPSVYVVQLGFGPKIRSLLLVEELRKHGIQVHQNLTCDSLSTQLRDAEARRVRHTVIIGQKEYMEGTVILRDMEARSQESVPQTELSSLLKKVAIAA